MKLSPHIVRAPVYDVIILLIFPDCGMIEHEVVFVSLFVPLLQVAAGRCSSPADQEKPGMLKVYLVKGVLLHTERTATGVLVS